MVIANQDRLNVRNLAYSALFDSATRTPENVAIRTPGRIYTYRDVSLATERFASLLAHNGVKKGDIVTIAIPDGLAFVAAFFGTMSIGATALLTNANATHEKIAHVLHKSGSRLLVTTDKFDLTETHCTQLKVTHDLQLNNWKAHSYEKQEWVNNSEIAYLILSSGSTGQPKFIPHRHSDLLYCSQYYADVIIKYQEGDVVISIPKLSFGYALGCNLIFPFLHSASIVLIPQVLEGNLLIESFRTFRPTLLFAQPRNIRYIVDTAEGIDVISIRLATVAGESLSSEIFDDWNCRFPSIPLLDGYGTSEIGSIFISNQPGSIKRGSLGKLLDGFQTQIRRISSAIAHDLGELWVTAPSVCAEYLFDSKISSENISDGWIRTGDLFRQDQDGYFYLVGRIDDAIKVGCGEWIHPEEVENIICKIQGVRECVVLGYRDTDGIIRLRAYIVPNLHSRGSPQLKLQIQNFVASAYQGKTEYDVSRIEFLNEFPRTDTGKIDRSKLDSDFLTEFSYEC